MTEIAQKLVRVTGERNGMIEFDYGIGDLSYALELILPPEAFEAFCLENGVIRLEGDRTQAENLAARGMALRPSDVGRQH